MTILRETLKAVWRLEGVAVCDSAKARVKSEDGQISYPVSLDERGVRPPTPLLDVFAITFKSSSNMKLLVRRENWVVGPTPAQLLSN